MWSYCKRKPQYEVGMQIIQDYFPAIGAIYALEWVPNYKNQKMREGADKLA